MEFLQDVLDLIVAQLEGDWEQIKGWMEWCSDHYRGICIATVGIPLLGLIIAEGICWIELFEIQAKLAQMGM